MKIGKYISTVITALIIFIVGWITIGIVEIPKNGESPFLQGILSALIICVFIIYFIPTTISMILVSIKRTFKFKNDKGLWKILTLAFGIGMILLSGLIAIFAIVWTSFAIKDGLAQTYNDGFNGWLYANINAAKSFISGDYILPQDVLSGTPFGLLVTSFVFILIWAGAGITYEIIKKILGGNPKWNNENNNNMAQQPPIA